MPRVGKAAWFVLAFIYCVYNYAELQLWPGHHAWAGQGHLKKLQIQKKCFYVSRHRMGQTLQDGAFVHKAYQTDVFISHSTLAPLSATDGIASECWLNMPWLCPGNPIDMHLLKMGRISSKIGENLCQRTLETLRCIQRRVCMSLNLGTSSKWLHTNSYILGWSASRP